MRRTLLLVPLLAVAAHAGTQPPGTGQGRAAIDADGDGYVSRAEAQGHPRLLADFEKADTNADGRLDAAEMNAHRDRVRVEKRARAEQRWKAADVDGDGALSRAEAEASMPRVAERFEQVDADGDGRVSRDEMHSQRVRGKHEP